MSWLSPLKPVEFRALPEKVHNGRPHKQVRFRGVWYPSIVDCARTYGWSVSHMKKILAGLRRGGPRESHAGGGKGTVPSFRRSKGSTFAGSYADKQARKAYLKGKAPWIPKD